MKIENPTLLKSKYYFLLLKYFSSIQCRSRSYNTRKVGGHIKRGFVVIGVIPNENKNGYKWFGNVEIDGETDRWRVENDDEKRFRRKQGEMRKPDLSTNTRIRKWNEMQQQIKRRNTLKVLPHVWFSLLEFCKI